MQVLPVNWARFNTDGFSVIFRINTMKNGMIARGNMFVALLFLSGHISIQEETCGAVHISAMNVFFYGNINESSF